MAACGIAFQPIADQTVKTIESLPQIGGAGGHVDPRGRSKPEHRLQPVQYGQQPLQRSHIESSPHFDPTATSQLNHQNTIAPRIPVRLLAGGPNDFERKHRPATRLFSLVHPPAIFIQSSNCQAALPTKCLPHQATRFKLGNQRLGLGLTAPPPYHSCFAHSSSPSPYEALQQSGLV